MARAAAAQAQPAPARPRVRPRSKAARRPAPRRRVAGGAFWIGVVALNVAVLRLNVRLDDTSRERARLRADNSELNSEIAARAASGRIITLASDRLGLAPAGPDNWTYLHLGR